MDIKTQRKIDLYAGTLICRLLSLFIRKKESVNHAPQKILVILLSEMGSLVLARPMFNKLKSKYPDAELYGLLFRQNRIMLEILGDVPVQNIITVRNDSFFQMISTSIRALVQMRRLKIDTVIDCELFSRISSIFSFLSGATVRVGFHPHNQEGLYRGSLLNRPILYNPYYHIAQQFITLAEAIGAPWGMPKVKRMIEAVEVQQQFQVQFLQEEIEEYKSKFFKDFPNIKPKKIVLLYPSGGLLPIRAWPLRNYCEISKSLLEMGYAVAIIGMPDDKDLSKQIQTHCNHEDCIDLAGYTASIRELMILFQFTSLLITNDGGPGHFAAMTPIPSIIFYGPETPLLYGPMTENTFVFHKPLSCSPCLTAYNHRNSPCDGNNQCLKLIGHEEVIEKAVEMLSKESEKSTCRQSDG